MRPRWIAYVLLIAATPTLASAEPIVNVPVTGLPQKAAPQEDAMPDVFSSVSFIDGALPRTMLRTRFDVATHIHQPTRSEFFQTAGGLPGLPGPPLPERRLDYQEARTYGEFALASFFSLFIDTGMRWVNPDFNQNTSGMGDMDLGFKLATWTEDNFLATIQFRAYLPTAANSALGTRHVSLEPGLLLNWRPVSMITLEGEIRDVIPLGGSDFSGNVLRYGLGLVYGQQAAEGMWITPVAEFVGWTCLDGQALLVGNAPPLVLENAAGQTILNGALGVRFGMGERADFYAGYNRCFTNRAWYRDMIRLEFRVHF